MKTYILTTNEECVVRYDYVIDAENEFDAVRKYILDGGDQIDHEVIQDNRVLSVKNVKEAPHGPI